MGTPINPSADLDSNEIGAPFYIDFGPFSVSSATRFDACFRDEANPTEQRGWIVTDDNLGHAIGPHERRIAIPTPDDDLGGWAAFYVLALFPTLAAAIAAIEEDAYGPA